YPERCEGSGRICRKMFKIGFRCRCRQAISSKMMCRDKIFMKGRKMLRSWIALIMFSYVSLSSGDVYAAIDCNQFYGVYFFERQNPFSAPTVYKIELTASNILFNPSADSYTLYDSPVPVQFKRLSSQFMADEYGCTATVQFTFWDSGPWSSCAYQAKVSVSLLSNGKYAFRIRFPTIASQQNETTPCLSNLETGNESVYFADKIVP
ncbi:MAG: hypothetical protein NTV34_06355, partial [Proteobacteria bacterium]|nr:hypothetical protein [Pseudomonadota bacterium]